jgi:hypothetical protein
MSVAMASICARWASAIRLHRLAVDHQKAGLVLGVGQLGGAFAVACRLQLVDRRQMLQHRLSSVGHGDVQLAFRRARSAACPASAAPG